MSEEQQVESTAESEIVTEGGDPLLAEATEAERPEWLPEKFKSPSDMAEAYSNLESKLGSSEKDVRESLIKELEEEAYANRPETVGDYKLPEVIDESLAVDNQLLQWWANHSFENGFSQEEFEQGIQLYAESSDANTPDYDAIVEEEMGKLGDNATARTEAVGLFANKFFPAEQLSAIERMCETAEGVLALEHIMENMREGGPATASTPVHQVSESELKSMMMDDRYHNPTKRDPDFVKQVQDGFQKLYG